MFILWLGVVLIIAISLVTYNPADSQLVNDPMGSERITNSIGKVGAKISDVLFALFGFCAYGILIFLVYIGYAFLWSNVSWLRIRYDVIAIRIIGFTLLLLSLCALAAVANIPFMEGLETSFNFSKGGHLGHLTFENAKPLLGYDGAVMVMLILFIMGFYLFTDCSIIVICEAVGGVILAVLMPHTTIKRFINWLRGDSADRDDSKELNEDQSDNADFGIKVLKSPAADPVPESTAADLSADDGVVVRVTGKTEAAEAASEAVQHPAPVPEPAARDSDTPAVKPAKAEKSAVKTAPETPVAPEKTSASMSGFSPVPEYGRPNLGGDAEEDLYIPGLGAADPDKVREKDPEPAVPEDAADDLSDGAGPSIDFGEMERSFVETEPEEEKVIPAVTGHRHTNVLPPRPRVSDDEEQDAESKAEKTPEKPVEKTAERTASAFETKPAEQSRQAMKDPVLDPAPVSPAKANPAPSFPENIQTPAQSPSAEPHQKAQDTDSLFNLDGDDTAPASAMTRDSASMSAPQSFGSPETALRAESPVNTPVRAPQESQAVSAASGVSREQAASSWPQNPEPAPRVYPDNRSMEALQHPGQDRMNRNQEPLRPDSRVYEPALQDRMTASRAAENRAPDLGDRHQGAFADTVTGGREQPSGSVYQDKPGYQDNVSRSSIADLSAPDSGDDGFKDPQPDNFNVINFNDVKEQREAELRGPDFDTPFGDLPSGFSRIDETETASRDSDDAASSGFPPASGFTPERPVYPEAGDSTGGVRDEVSGNSGYPASESAREDVITRVRDPDIPSSINYHDGYYDVEVHGEFPPTSIFKSSTAVSTVDRAEMDEMADNLDQVLKDYRFKAHVAYDPVLDADGNQTYDAEGNLITQKLYDCGPIITRYYLDLEPGQPSGKLFKITTDIGRALQAGGEIMIQSQISGSSYVGVDIPNKKRQTISMRELLESPEFVNSKAALPAILGRDVSGKPFVYDVAQAPHLLIAGTTGSGKSVGINVILVSLMMRHTPETLRLILIDPKQVEFAVYKDVPHLLTPVITDMHKALSALKWACDEMERRYTLLSHFEVRKLEVFNEKVRQWNSEGQPRKDPTWNPQDSMEPEAPYIQPLPFIFVVVDEFADIMLSLKKQKSDFESAISRIAAKARAVGIHLLLATQSPRKEFITGQIKANLPTQIAFKVRSNIESQLVLGVKGAEGLLGRGDMLAKLNGDTADIRRLHGAFASDDEINMFTEAWRARGKPEYVDKVTEMFVEQDADAVDIPSGGNSLENDPLYAKIVDFCRDLKLRNKGVSISLIQRQFSIGYNRAANFVTALEQNGVVSPATGGNGSRDILID